MSYTTPILAPPPEMTPAEAATIMEALGLNQMDLGLLLGVYPSTISRWTNPELRHAVPGHFALILEWMRDIPEVRARAMRKLGKPDPL